VILVFLQKYKIARKGMNLEDIVVPRLQIIYFKIKKTKQGPPLLHTSVIFFSQVPAKTVCVQVSERNSCALHITRHSMAYVLPM